MTAPTMSPGQPQGHHCLFHFLLSPFAPPFLFPKTPPVS